MKCHKAIIPVNSLTQQYLPVDYTDAFACEVVGSKKLYAEEGRMQTVTAITLVHYHNRLGKIYFSLIGLFHKVIVKSMLKATLTRIVSS